MAKKIRVLIVDDSPLICQLLVSVFAEDQIFEVVGVAHDPYEARKLIKKTNPDVLTLDVEMPRMDGITFLDKLMRLRPMPVVMCSSITRRGSATSLEALRLGAFDVIRKPGGSTEGDVSLLGKTIRLKVRAAATATPRQEKALGPRSTSIGIKSDVLIGLGASTGGTQALRQVLSECPEDMPPVLIVQHLPEAFSASFADRLNSVSAMNVKVAADGDAIAHGCAYLAPGDQHMQVVKMGAGYRIKLTKSAKVNHHRPAVDPLFSSMAKACGHNVIAGLLTGMGEDGARGMKELRAQGAHTLAQDEASSVVWGMPGAAVRLSAACEIKSLDEFGASLLRTVKAKFLKRRTKAC